MKANKVYLSEQQLKSVVAKILAENMEESKFTDALKGLGTFAKMSMSPESKYYFENNKKWARVARKICSKLDELMQYVGEVCDDEDYEGLEQAYNTIENLANNLESKE